MSRLSRAGSAGAVGPRAVFHDQGWLTDYWIVLNCSSIILQVATEIDCETECILFNLCSLVLVCISGACLVRSLPVLMSFHPCIYLWDFVCICVWNRDTNMMLNWISIRALNTCVHCWSVCTYILVIDSLLLVRAVFFRVMIFTFFDVYTVNQIHHDYRDASQQLWHAFICNYDLWKSYRSDQPSQACHLYRFTKELHVGRSKPWKPYHTSMECCATVPSRGDSASPVCSHALRASGESSWGDNRRHKYWLTIFQ